MTDSRPRILHVVGDSEYGGASRMIIDLSRAATEAGYRVWVLTTNPRFREELAQEGIGVQDLDHVRRKIQPWRDLLGLVRLATHIRRAGYTVVHTHTTKGGVIGRVAARLGGAPLVVHTVHGYAFNDSSPRLVAWLISAVERFAALFSDYVVTVSEHHADVTVSRHIAPPHKVVAIPNGVADLADLADKADVADVEGPSNLVDGSSAEGEDGSSTGGEDGFRLLFFGRLAAQKGVAFLIDAVALLRDRDVPVVVDILGEGPLGPDLCEQVEDRVVGDRVHFRGFVDSSEMAPFFAGADLVVLPSLWEGMSISLLETLRAGLPVVTTSIPSNLEVIGPSGCAVVVEPGDPEALALAIAQTLQDPHLLASLGRRARARFVERFTLDRTVRAYVDLYDRHRAVSGARQAKGR